MWRETEGVAEPSQAHKYTAREYFEERTLIDLLRNKRQKALNIAQVNSLGTFVAQLLNLSLHKGFSTILQ